MNPCDPISQQARQDLLDRAYELDGRLEPDHPFHCTYTALRTTAAYESLQNPNDRGSACPVVA